MGWLLDVPKPDQEEPASAPVLGDFEQSDNPSKSGAPSHFWRDVLECNFLERLYHDVPRRQSIPSTYPHTRALPHADAAGDLALPDPVP